MSKKSYGLSVVVVAMLLTLTGLAPVFAGLPPRPTPSPAPTPEKFSPAGAQLVLQTHAGPWSVVQWQDINGAWHDVDGWRGAVENGTVTWWVAPKDFGTGPFRWAVSLSAASEIVAAGEPFTLPAASNETVIVTVP